MQALRMHLTEESLLLVLVNTLLCVLLQLENLPSHQALLRKL